MQSSSRAWSRQQSQWSAYQTLPIDYLEDNVQFSPAIPSFWSKSRASDHVSPASMRSRPGPMMDGPGFGVMPMMANRVVDFETEERYSQSGPLDFQGQGLDLSVVPQDLLVLNATKQHPDLPLAKFLEQFAAWVSQGNLNGKFDIGNAAGPFLKRVSSTYNHHTRWVTDQAAARERPAAEIEQELAATLLLIRDCRSLDLAARLLSTVEASLKRTERMNATFASQLNQTTAAIADERGTPAFGRTARVEWLMSVGDDASVAQARELVRTDLAESIAIHSESRRGASGHKQVRNELAESIAIHGILELNGETRSAFVKHYRTPDGQPCGPWGELVKQAALELLN